MRVLLSRMAFAWASVKKLSRKRTRVLMPPRPISTEGTPEPGEKTLLSFFCTTIESFAPLFHRSASFWWFAIFMIGLIVRQDHLGVCSIVRWLDLTHSSYPALIHFFRSSAWKLTDIMHHWWTLLTTTFGHHAMLVNGRLILLGDHTKQAKDGRRMPGVRTLHQDSETSSKPSFFRGHNIGFLAIVMGIGKNIFATPLWGQIHQGAADIGKKESSDDDSPMTIKMIQMALDFITHTKRACYLVLDAYFASGPCLKKAQTSAKLSEAGQQMLHIITRAKSNVVAREAAPAPTVKKRGRPRKYGDKVHLAILFETAQEKFIQATCLLYHQKEQVSYLCLDLLWPAAETVIRFVLAQTPRGHIILMSTDRIIDPISIIELYCYRSRIETMFSVLKHNIGGLTYRFWTTALQRRSRRPQKNDTQNTLPPAEKLPKIEKTWDAIERYMNLAAIALGLLQIISLKFAPGWEKNVLWLRTYNREKPSEELVKNLLTNEVHRNFSDFTSHAIMQTILCYRKKAGETEEMALRLLE